METEKNTKSDKNQTNLLIGVSFIILGIVFACFAFMQPRVSSDESQIANVSNTVLEEQSSQSTSQIGSQNENVSNKNSKSNNKEKSSVNVNYPLNLNTCTLEELQTIKNIGESRAKAIIAYRDVLGGYSNVNQLKEISGIGDTVFESIKPYVTV